MDSRVPAVNAVGDGQHDGMARICLKTVILPCGGKSLSHVLPKAGLEALARFDQVIELPTETGKLGAGIGQLSPHHG